jgi:hypothetical protein
VALGWEVGLALGWEIGLGVAVEVPQAEAIAARATRIEALRRRRRSCMRALCQARSAARDVVFSAGVRLGHRGALRLEMWVS